jgi:uncharacterized membrane protein YoaK (UPF0700 family)
LNPNVIGAGLMLMSFGSGCMDILSYRFLGHVFTSAMTGNVALMGLDIGQGYLHEATHNLAAFVCFLGGLVLGAVLLRDNDARRGLRHAVAGETVLLIAFAVAWPLRIAESVYGLIGISAVAMGIQSAVAQRMGVAGVTTTYFTGTLTAIVFGLLGRPAAEVHPLRRVKWPLLAFLAYIVGACFGGGLTAGPPSDLRLLPAIPALAIGGLLLLLRFA